MGPNTNQNVDNERAPTEKKDRKVDANSVRTTATIIIIATLYEHRHCHGFSMFFFSSSKL